MRFLGTFGGPTGEIGLFLIFLGPSMQHISGCFWVLIQNVPSLNVPSLNIPSLNIPSPNITSLNVPSLNIRVGHRVLFPF